MSKIAITRSPLYHGAPNSCSAFVTYKHESIAAKVLKDIDGICVNGSTIRVSLGTNKYCSYFLNKQVCDRKGCLYLHSISEHDTRQSERCGVEGDTHTHKQQGLTRTQKHTHTKQIQTR
eukprot:GHVR01152212.1.p1 GENE.GHVR01152212.1~~GHVR01152212.1.p1  ORF type:complete len:119 (-),score=31.47 GHVR01152212.1:16-372(-)